MVMEAEFGEMSVNRSVEDENEVVYEKPIDIQLDNDDDDDEDDDDDAGVDAVDGITVDQEAEENYDDNEEEEEEKMMMRKDSLISLVNKILRVSMVDLGVLQGVKLSLLYL